jgi:hypothetical protein
LTTRLGYLESGARLSATDTPATFQVQGPNESRHAFILGADVAVHVARNATATTDDLRVPANTLVSVSAFAGDSISVVKATGEADGNAYLAKTDHD